MKKGFTLIELLAVIVILAIIAIIAVPIILNVISVAKQGAAESSALGYIEAAEKQVMINKVKDTNLINEGEYSKTELSSLGLNIKGEVTDALVLVNSKGKITEGRFCIDGYSIDYDGKNAKINNDEDYCNSGIESFLYTCSVAEGTEYVFSYTGGVQEFNVPCRGNYKLEVWGGSGTVTNYYNGTRPTAGKGSYATGTASLKPGTIYVVVGGGGVVTSEYDGTGGYNGGGNGAYPGGGATHIAKLTGTLAEIGETNKSKVYIVAAGGGSTGAAWSANASGQGGSGGAETGISGGDSTGSGSSSYSSRTASCTGGTGGTQTSGGTAGTGTTSTGDAYYTPVNGSFGQGGSSNGYASSGGGGGYYGGGTGYSVNDCVTVYNGGCSSGPMCGSGAGGGSSYIGGVTNGQMIAGNASMPTQDGTSTMTGNNGNGYAKITYLGK